MTKHRILKNTNWRLMWRQNSTSGSAEIRWGQESQNCLFITTDGFSYFIAGVFSTPAFSAPFRWTDRMVKRQFGRSRGRGNTDVNVCPRRPRRLATALPNNWINRWNRAAISSLPQARQFNSDSFFNSVWFSFFFHFGAPQIVWLLTYLLTLSCAASKRSRKLK